MKKIFIAFISLFMFNLTTEAASLCSYQEQTDLNQKAANVKVNYEIVEEKVTYPDGEGTRELFKINFFNLSNEFYVIVKNDVNSEEKRINSSDTKNGSYSFNWDNKETVTNFTIEIYTTNETNCPEELYKTIYLTTPRYNHFSETEACQDHKDLSYCQKYVNFDISEEDYFAKLNSFNNIKEDEKVKVDDTKNNNVIINFINDYKWYIVGGLAVVIVITAAITVINNKKMKGRK